MRQQAPDERIVCLPRVYIHRENRRSDSPPSPWKPGWSKKKYFARFVQSLLEWHHNGGEN